MSKLSSDNFSGGALPLVCERCGHLDAAPAAPSSQPSESAARGAERCRVCGHGWFVPLRTEQITVRRKPDRRAAARNK